MFAVVGAVQAMQYSGRRCSGVEACRSKQSGEDQQAESGACRQRRQPKTMVVDRAALGEASTLRLGLGASRKRTPAHKTGAQSLQFFGENA